MSAIYIDGKPASALLELASAVYELARAGRADAVLVEMFATGKTQWRHGKELIFVDNRTLVFTREAK